MALEPGVEPLASTDPPRIGPYRLLGRLGRGGMATVYLGAGEDDEQVAVKLIHPHLAGDAEFRLRFSREVELARRVPDFCTAPVRDDGEHDGRPYLVTAYLVGLPLHRLVLDEGPLDPAALHNLAIGVAAALTAIHDSDLVHRDLKPSNVMVTRGGVRIIDFGIARALDLSTGYTASGMVMGSLGWASPEQLNGLDPTPAMDVFGWGCLVAYAASGQHPFGGADATTRSWRILHAEPALEALSPWLRDLVEAAVAKTAEDRPTAQELLLGLVGGRPAGGRRSADGGRPATPRIRPAAQPVQDRAAARRRLLFVAVPLVGVVAGLGTAGAFYTNAGPHPPGPATSTETGTASSVTLVSNEPGRSTGPRATPAGGGAAITPTPAPEPAPGAASTGPASEPAPAVTGTDDGQPGNGNGRTRTKKPKP